MKKLKRRISYALYKAFHAFSSWLYKVYYEPPQKCKACGWTELSHKSDCPRLLEELTLEGWRRRAEEYYSMYKGAYERNERAWGEASKWQAHYHTLRLENNALRRKRVIDKVAWVVVKGGQVHAVIPSDTPPPGAPHATVPDGEYVLARDPAWLERRGREREEQRRSWHPGTVDSIMDGSAALKVAGGNVHVTMKELEECNSSAA